MKKVLVVAMTIFVCLVSLSAQAVENKAQMGAVISTGRQVIDSVDLNASMVFINLMSNHAPYTSLSLKTKLTQYFSVSSSVGYGFEEPDEDEGWFYGIDTSWQKNDLVFNNSVYYYDGLEAWYSGHSLSYPLGFTRVGIDARNFYYTEEIDEASRSYQLGPAILISFKENCAFKLNYYYAFEPEEGQSEEDGVLKTTSPEDSNVFKVTMILSF